MNQEDVENNVFSFGDDQLEISRTNITSIQPSYEDEDEETETGIGKKQDDDSSVSIARFDNGGETDQVEREGEGSSIIETIFNLTNSIIGAGAIGLGEAFANSGGIISVLLLIFFGCLAKLSADIIIDLSLQISQQNHDDEEGNALLHDDGGYQSLDSSNSSSSSRLSIPSESGTATATATATATTLFTGGTGNSDTINNRGDNGIHRYIVVSRKRKGKNKNSNNNDNNDNTHSFSPAITPSSQSYSSYESLGKASYGKAGFLMVMFSKFLYSFGCLIAYIIVIKDNLGSGIYTLVPELRQHSQPPASPFVMKDYLLHLLSNDNFLTLLACTFIILPLCFMREMTPLSKFSVLSILSMALIVGIVIFLYVENPGGNLRLAGNGFHEDWIEIRPGIFSSLGTFIFTFVSHHTAHLTYNSMHPRIRSIRSWKRVSSVSNAIATTISTLVGLFVYMTFWQDTQSDVFGMYPSSLKSISYSKLLLCVAMTLTFPLSFFTCRDLLIILSMDIYDKFSSRNNNSSGYSRRGITPSQSGSNLLSIPLLSSQDHHYNDDEYNNNNNTNFQPEQWYTQLKEQLQSYPSAAPSSANSIANSMSDSTTTATPITNNTTFRNQVEERLAAATNSRSYPFLLPASSKYNSNQFILCYHVIITFSLWAITTTLAVVSPSLGDILDLVGSMTGTLVAFVLPGLFSFKIKGRCTWDALLIILVGGCVGCVGTYFSMFKLISDVGVL